jgi:hypothetical protein
MILSAVQAMRITEMLASAGVVISSLEVLARPRWLADTSWNSWTVHRLRYASTAGGPVESALTVVFAYPQILGVVAARALSALAILLIPLAGPAHAALLAVVAAGLAVRMLRSPYGGEGSDQVFCIVFVTLAAVAAHPSPTTIKIGLWFIAAQACLAYCTSGISKIASKVWWNGSALLGVLRTRSWGNPALAAWLGRHETVNRWTSRLIGITEACFPLVLLAPPSLVTPILLAGLLFHLVCAAVMGLNCFVWAFAATYAAIAFTALN